jgi:hypothetical protein
VTIVNSTFQRFSSCGALIKNFETHADPAKMIRENGTMPDERNVSMSYVDWFQNTADVYNYRNKKYSLKMQADGMQRR